MKLICRLNRISAWVLVISFILYMISGLDLLGRYLAPQISSFIHFKYLFIPAQLSFIIHSSFGIQKAFERWKLKSLMQKILLAIYILLIMSLFILYINIQI